MSDTMWILVIDIGSSSIRGTVYDTNARPVDDLSCRSDLRLETDTEGKATLDADEVCESVERIIDGVLSKAAGRAERIAAVGMDTLVGNAVGLDAEGRPVTPVYTYADTRSREDLRFWRSVIQEQEDVIVERTGCPQHTAYMPARFLWLSRTNEEIWRRVRRWSDLGGYCYSRWFGSKEVPCSYSVASWSGLLNRRELEWDELVLSQLPISSEQLPLLADYDDRLTGLSAEYARRWPALAECPFFLAVGDGVAANIGSGGVGPDSPVVTIGSTSAMRVAVPGAPQVPSGLWCYRVDRDVSLLGGALAEGGNVCAWLWNTLQIDRSNLESELERIVPDSHGLTVLPFWFGERSPGYASDARAGILGLTAATTPIEILRASMEAVAYRLAIVAERLNPVCGADTSLIANGNALLSSPTWTQIVADVLGRPVCLSIEPEATSRGVALMVLNATGQIDNYNEIPACCGEVFEPDQERHAIYRQALTRQCSFYPRIVQ